MSNYTIQDFWKPRLPVARLESASLIRGWSFEDVALATFTEAPLTMSAEFDSDSNPQLSSILLVSAPGAVGKSTLARQIAFVTGAVYLDLAKADPVGGNTLSGGLVRSGLYPNRGAQTTAVLVDGLDEARLRVTQEAFEAFLSDIADLSRSRTVLTVLFGRTGAVQDAWLVLTESDANVAVLEIGYYGPEASVDFAVARLRAAHPNSPHLAAEGKAVELLLERLRNQTENDGDRFAGYAPVLQAVAERVAEEGNPSALVAQIEGGAQPVTLRAVASAILERERHKLDQLPFEDPRVADSLYLPDEQLDRLVARLYGLSPPDLPAIGAKDAQAYGAALDTWVAEHPFLDGGGGTSSAVFDAMISIRALRKPASAERALQRELRRGAAANPFLSEFYAQPSGDSDRVFLPPEHIGIVYASLRAQLSLGDTASLLVEGLDEAEDEEALRAEVEITFARRGEDRPRVLQFDSEQIGTIRLGASIEDVDIAAPHASVEIGPGAEAVLIAPVNIQCARLSLTTEKVIVENPAGRHTAAVFLEADDFDGAQMVSVAVLRGDVSLAVSWPGVRGHPWTSFATSPTPTEDPRVDEALRRLRKFVIACRSHSRGRLGRFKGKIEHARMTKGTGQKVLDLMMAEGVLSLEGSIYFLDPDQLAAQAGTNYGDCMARRFGAEAVAFVRRALD